MTTLTFFRDFDFSIPNGTVAYLADHTYPDVPDAAVAMAIERGVAEIVPDDILAEPGEDDPLDPPATKTRRTRMKKSW